MQAGVAGTLDTFLRRRGRQGQLAEEKQARLIAEIERDIRKVCRGYDDFSQQLRHFAARYLSSEKVHKAVLGVVSAQREEGRTTVGLALADALADIYEDVLFVEMGSDGSRNTLANDLGLSISVGLAECLRDETELDSAIVPTTRTNLSLLPVSPQTETALHLESTRRARTMLATLRRRFDVVLVDLPPLLENEEAPTLVAHLDGVVVVARAGKTSADAVAKTIELCGDVPVRGVLLNQSRPSTPKWIARLFGA